MAGSNDDDDGCYIQVLKKPSSAVELPTLSASSSTIQAKTERARSNTSEAKLQAKRRVIRMLMVIVALFFICWMPYHVFVLLELNHQNYDHKTLTTGLQIGTSLAAANSFLNPVLYVFMGNDFKQKFKSCVLSRMENAMGEEGRTISRYLSRSSSVDGRASTHIWTH